ncbi:hypothetical protein BTA49_09450 [Pseudomonas mosselii]|nr:hypothetical protein BTA49_09450 [Pseudomonas mosselii]
MLPDIITRIVIERGEQCRQQPIHQRGTSIADIFKGRIDVGILTRDIQHCFHGLAAGMETERGVPIGTIQHLSCFIFNADEQAPDRLGQCLDCNAFIVDAQPFWIVQQCKHWTCLLLGQESVGQGDFHRRHEVQSILLLGNRQPAGGGALGTCLPVPLPALANECGYVQCAKARMEFTGAQFEHFRMCAVPPL